MKTLYFTILILYATSGLGQSKPSDNFLQWSANQKLTLNDFAIKTKNLQTAASYADFSITFEVHGFDFLAKNFNRKVQNYLIKSASWIDTTYNIALSLQYQQTLFDMCEIYTRRFRKALKENRKKIVYGLEFIKDLNAQTMTDFSHRRIQYDTETAFGTNAVAQRRWEEQIETELIGLKQFSAKK